ncbi:hypothetical protein ACLOJK_020328 [Asimina triloba]
MDVLFFTAFLFFLRLLFFLCCRSFLRRWSPNGRRKVEKNLPPSPIALPFLGHLHLLGPLLHQSLDALAKRYGPIIHLRLGSMGNTVVVSSPALAKEFLKTHDIAFASRPPMVGQEFIGHDSVSFTFLPYGSCWKFMKKLFMTDFFSARKLERTARIRQEEVRWLLGCLLEKSRAGEPADLEEMLAVLTNSIICRMTMGSSWKSLGRDREAEELRKVVLDHIELAGKLNIVHLLLGSVGKFDLFGYGKSLKRENERYVGMVEKILEEHERKRQQVEDEDGENTNGEEEEEDLVDILLKILEDDGIRYELTRPKIKTFLMDILGAGTETSAVAMQWALAELLNHPDIFRKAREEIDSVVGTNRLVQESDVPSLRYIQAVVKETLRLHPPAPLDLRLCRQDCTVAGFHIPQNTKLLVNAWSLGRDPEHWENPLEFQPERFLDSNGACQNTVDVKGQHFQLLPFGSGRRMCPGMPLALPLMQVTIASVVQCFDWMASEKHPNSTATMALKEKAGFTLRMAQPLRRVPVARSVPLINEFQNAACKFPSRRRP